MSVGKPAGVGVGVGVSVGVAAFDAGGTNTKRTKTIERKTVEHIRFIAIS